LIELHNLSKRYGGHKAQPVQALNALSLLVPAGSLYGLLGPNGAGKTTALRILCTLLEPDSGQVLVGGIDALAEPRRVRELLGYVAQEVALDKILTGRELLRLQGDLHHLPSRQRDRRIEELVTLLVMGEWIDRRCGTYSGGMRRRLDLASGLLHDPRVLVLDEPTVGLDIESRSAIWQVLRQLRDQGTTVLLSSHYLEEVDALADRLAILEGGRVIAEGVPSDLKAALGGDRVTLRVREFSDDAEAQRVQSLLKGCPGIRQVVVNRAQGYSLNLVVENGEAVDTLRRQLSEAGLPVFRAEAWIAVLVPARTPPERVARLNTLLTEAMRLGAPKLAAIGLQPMPEVATPEQVTRFVREDIARLGPLLRAVGVQPE
jgi:ABC-2 type transport system ATP-binding protein